MLRSVTEIEYANNVRPASIFFRLSSLSLRPLSPVSRMVVSFMLSSLADTSPSLSSSWSANVDGAVSIIEGEDWMEVDLVSN